MPPRTPRKTRQRHQNNGSQSQSQPVPVQASDYESEAFYAAPVPSRSPEEINFSVVQRYVPALHEIICIAPSAQIYTFSPETNAWEKASIEGTLFLCKLTPSPISGAERHCVVVLNRKGLENLIIEVGEVESVEVTNEFLLLTFHSRDGHTTAPKTLGLYIQSDITPRERICEMVKEYWEAAMMERDRTGVEANYAEEEIIPSIEGGADKPMGKRLSLTDLFGQR